MRIIKQSKHRQQEQESDIKLSELILYVSSKCQGDPLFGATKLNKVLFYSDFLSFRKTGKAITGSEYFKLDHGPAPRRLLPVRANLLQKQRAALQKTDFAGYTQDRIVVTSQPDLSLFTGEEIALVDWVIDTCKSSTGSDLSEASHSFIGWEVALQGETIPYATVYVSKRGPNEKAIEHAQKIESSLVG